MVRTTRGAGTQRQVRPPGQLVVDETADLVGVDGNFVVMERHVATLGVP